MPRSEAVLGLLVVRATVRVPAAKPGRRWDDHHIGYLPQEGWFCDCPKATRCTHIKIVRNPNREDTP